MSLTTWSGNMYSKYPLDKQEVQIKEASCMARFPSTLEHWQVRQLNKIKKFMVQFTYSKNNVRKAKHKIRTVASTVCGVWGYLQNVGLISPI